MGDICWFRVGGAADVVFMPADVEDLSAFLVALPEDVPLSVVGAGSNVLARDGGIRGAVIRLGSSGQIAQSGDVELTVGAAALDVRVARCRSVAVGLELLSRYSRIDRRRGGDECRCLWR